MPIERKDRTYLSLAKLLGVNLLQFFVWYCTLIADHLFRFVHTSPTAAKDARKRISDTMSDGKMSRKNQPLPPTFSYL